MAMLSEQEEEFLDRRDKKKKKRRRKRREGQGQLVAATDSEVFLSIICFLRKKFDPSWTNRERNQRLVGSPSKPSHGPGRIELKKQKTCCTWTVLMGRLGQLVVCGRFFSGVAAGRSSGGSTGGRKLSAVMVKVINTKHLGL